MIKFFQGRLILVRIIMLSAMFALILIGIANIYAAGNPVEEHSTASQVPSGAWKKQAVYAAAGLVAMIMINLINYRTLGTMSYWIYAFMLAVLATLLLGKFLASKGHPLPFVDDVKGAFRWIKIFPGRDIKIQPSEFCKIAYILALAWYLRFRSNYTHFKGLIGPFVLTLLSMVLILLEPDLGTVMLMMPVLFSMLFVAGAKPKHFILIILLAAAASPVLWHQMNPYQRRRISCVLLQGDKIHLDDPENTHTFVQQLAADHPTISKILTGSERFDKAKWQNSWGYQLRLSKFAIASGGLNGYGFRKGPYIKYERLPERHNDFIFAIIAHQFGLIGCLTVFALYTIIIACGIEIAWLNTDPLARLIAVGIMAMFIIQVVVNVSMNMGLMPITGLTLPLISYGGSSLVVSMTAIGLLNNVGRARPFSVAGKAFESSS